MAVVAREGCYLHYTVRGNGPPVLFIQGVGVQGDGWLPQIDDLSAEFTCISFDNRGMGRSQPVEAVITIDRLANDAAAILDAERVRSAHVVGHLLGGLVALQMALSHRERVKSLAGARYVEVADASHTLPIRHADLTNQLLREHLGVT